MEKRLFINGLTTINFINVSKKMMTNYEETDYNMKDIIITKAPLTCSKFLYCIVIHPVIKTYLFFKLQAHILRPKAFSFKRLHDIKQLTKMHWFVHHLFLFYAVSLSIKLYSNKRSQHLQTQINFLLQS